MRLALGCFLALASCAGLNMPQTDCAANPAYTTRAQVDACRAAVRDASVKDGDSHE